MAPRAVQDDAGEDEDHGGDRDQVSDVLLRPEPCAVVMRGGGEVDDQVDRDAHDPEHDAQVDQTRHARHVSRDVADGLYH